MTRARLARWAALPALALALTGCTVGTQPNDDSALAELEALPSWEETQRQLNSAADEITTAATRLFPGITFERMHGEEDAGCMAPFDKTDGRSHYLADRIASDVAVSEEQWSAFEQAARDAAAKIGATASSVMQNSPGKHHVSFGGPGGMYVSVVYQGNLVIAGYTGCRLPADKKQ